MTKLLFDDSHEVHGNWGRGKILGSGLLDSHSGGMIGESIGMAAEVAHGSCTLAVRTCRLRRSKPLQRTTK